MLAARAPQLEIPRVDLFRLLSEPGRLQVLALCLEEELAVGELAVLLRDGQPQVSRRVGALRDAGLLEARRDGTRIFLRTVAQVAGEDPVVADAVAEGRRLCLADGSLSRMPSVVAAREQLSVTHFEDSAPARTSVPSSPEHLAHLAALAPLLPGRSLAVDVGTGDGLALDVLAPLFERVIAVDRSRAQLARVAEHVASRGFHQVSLFPGSYDDVALLERVDAAGGADLVFAGRTLHHAPRPSQAVQCFTRLLRPGGHLVVLDYLPHQADALRADAGDVWLGFSVEDVRRFLTEANLALINEVAIPASFHPTGPDASLGWYVWVGQRSDARGPRPLSRQRSSTAP